MLCLKDLAQIPDCFRDTRIVPALPFDLAFFHNSLKRTMYDVRLVLILGRQLVCEFAIRFAPSPRRSLGLAGNDVALDPLNPVSYV